MAYVIINDTHLKAIADALRAKGTTDVYKPRDMAEAIEGFSIGGYNGLLGKYFNGVDVPGAAVEVMLKDCLDDDGTMFIPDGMWSGKTIQGSVVIPFGLTEVPANAFKDVEGITNVSFPYGLLVIGDSAFQNAINSNRDIIISGDIQTIGAKAFYDSTFHQLGLNGDITVGDYAFGHEKYSNNTSALEEITLNGNITFGKYVFQNNTALTTVNGVVTNVPEGLFCGCCELTGVSLSDDVETIEAKAFYYTGLIEITIPPNVISIGNQAFYGCDRPITSVEPYPMFTITLNDKLETIGDEAFYGCQHMYEITLPDSLKTIGYRAFYNTALHEITIPGSIKYIPQETFHYCGHLEKIKLNEGLEAIGARAFANTGTIFYSVVCPSTLRSIETGAFANSTLYSISLNEGLETIGDGAFADTPMTGLGCPSTLTSFDTNIVSNSNSQLGVLEFKLSPNHKLNFTGSPLMMDGSGYVRNQIIFKGQGKIPKSASYYLFSHSSVNNANTTISVPWSESENPVGFPWGATNATIKYNNGL